MRFPKAIAGLLVVGALAGMARAKTAGEILTATGLSAQEVIVLTPGTLPRTSSGKLRRQEALRRHLAGTLTPPRRMNVLRIAGALARSQWAFARTPK